MKIFSFIVFLQSVIFSQPIFTETQTNEVFNELSFYGSVYNVCGDSFVIENKTLSVKNKYTKDIYLLNGHDLEVPRAIKLKIFNVLGQLLLETKNGLTNILRLQNGIYFIMAYYEDHVTSFKILKHK